MRHIKVVLKTCILRRHKSKLFMCIAHLNRNYCCPDSHPQYLFVLWKNYLSQHVMGPRTSFKFLDGCRGAGTGTHSLGQGCTRGWQGLSHHTSQEQGSQEAPGQPQPQDRSLQAGPAQWGLQLGRAVGSWRQALLQHCWDRARQPQVAHMGSWAGTVGPISTLGAQTEASPTSKVCPHSLQRFGFRHRPACLYPSRTETEVAARSIQEARP